MFQWTMRAKIRFTKAICHTLYMRTAAALPLLNNNKLTMIYKIILLPFIIMRYAGIFLKKENFICIPNLDLILTSKCTLRCKGCSNLMPYFKDPISYSPEELMKDLDLLLSSLDLIYEVRLLGGEPFLYPQLGTIISKCLKKQKIKKIRIITNGTIMPSEDCLVFLDTLKPGQKKKLLFIISSYTSVADSVKNKLYIRLKEMGYCVYIAEKRVWSDQGLFKKRNFSTQVLRENYTTCSLCITLFNHEISMCSRAAHGTFLGLIPKTETEQVKLNGCSPEDIRRELNALFKKEYISTCDYCNGMKRNSIPAAIQPEPMESNSKNP
jgi:organic radical activating enzyme